MPENKTNNDNLKNALCYIPFVGIIIFFSENKKSDELVKNIKYSSFFLVVYIILYAILPWALWSILFLLYIWISIFLWYKAYSWEKIELEYIDKLEQKIKKPQKK